MMYRPRISVGTDDEDVEVVLDGPEDIFPRVLPMSHTLHTVRLSNCFLREIPEEFSTLLNLEQIYLDHNKIKMLPYTFHFLKKVKILHLHYNRISIAPLPIEGLLELDMFSNRLLCVPVIGLTTPLFDMAQNYMLYTVHDPVMSEKAQALRDKYGYVDRYDSSKPNAPTRMRILYNEFKESDTESEGEFAEEAAQEIVVPIVHNIITNGFGHSDTDSISSSDDDSADYENAIAFDNPPEENAGPVEAENNMGVQAYIIEFRHVNVDHIEHAENAAFMVNAYVQNGDDGNDGDEENDEAAENVAEINNHAVVNNEDEIGEFEDNSNRVNGLGV